MGTPPTKDDVVARQGSLGNPGNDSDGAVGSITSTVITDGAMDKLINAPPFGSEEKVYYGGFHYIQLASGILDNARAYNRCALRRNPFSGTLSIGFANGEDAGNKLFVMGLVSGNVQSEYVTCPDAAGFLPTVKTYDEDSWFFIEFVNSTNNTANPKGPFTINSNSGLTLGMMRGTNSNKPGGKDLSVRQLYSFLELALASAKNTGIELDNRLTPPEEADVSEFSQGCQWAGVDESVPVPSNVLNQNDSICVIGKMTLPADFATPAYGKLQTPLLLLGSAKP